MAGVWWTFSSRKWQCAYIPYGGFGLVLGNMVKQAMASTGQNHEADETLPSLVRPEMDSGQIWVQIQQFLEDLPPTAHLFYPCSPISRLNNDMQQRSERTRKQDATQITHERLNNTPHSFMR